MKTVDEIVSYIAERALEIKNPDPIVQMYAAKLEIDEAIGEVMRRLRGEEMRNKANRKKAELFANMLYRAFKPYDDYKGS